MSPQAAETPQRPDVRLRVVEYIKKGLHVLPVKPRKKKCTEDGWPTKTFSEDDFRPDSNVGLRLGAPHALADVDLDCEDARLIAPHFLPETGFTFGRESARASHWFYHLDTAVPSMKRIDPVIGNKPEGTLIELRCATAEGGIGFYTIAPGSIHETTGEAIDFESGATQMIQNCDAEEIVTAVNKIAAIALLKRYFPPERGGRNEAFLAIAGTLAKGGFTEVEAIEFNFAIYRLIWGTAANRRECTSEVRSTFAKHAAGKKLIGIPKLKRLIDARAVGAAFDWLHLKSIPANGASTPEQPQPEPSTASEPSGRGSRAYMSNDTGNADRLAAAYGVDLLYCKDRRSFYVWNGRFWEYDEFLEVEKRAEVTMRRAWGATLENEADSAERKGKLAFFSKSLSRKALENMVHLAKKKVRRVKAADFDSDPWLLNVQNGVIDLRDGTLKPHQREYLHTKFIPIDYSESAECPLFMSVLHRAMGGNEDAARADELVEYLQRCFGCAATGKPEKLLVLFYGSLGNNSKTTILETISRTLGQAYALKLPVESLMIDPHGASNATNSSLADLMGIRFVYTSEVDKGQRLSLAKVKDLLGLGTIKARRLRENWIEFPQQFKIFVDANDRPQISSPTDPIWNRVRCIPFDVQIPDAEIDTDLPRKLDLEMPGILKWLVDGAQRYMKSGLKNYPAEVGASTKAYRDVSDRLKDFVAARCSLNPNAWVSSACLMTAYQDWCSQGGDCPLPAHEFTDQIRAKGCTPEVKEILKKNTRGWKGIMLLETKA